MSFGCGLFLFLVGCFFVPRFFYDLLCCFFCLSSSLLSPLFLFPLFAPRQVAFLLFRALLAFLLPAYAGACPHYFFLLLFLASRFLPCAGFFWLHSAFVFGFPIFCFISFFGLVFFYLDGVFLVLPGLFLCLPAFASFFRCLYRLAHLLFGCFILVSY